MIATVDLLITNIGALATPTGTGPKRGREQGAITIIKDAAIGVTGGVIAYAGAVGGAPHAKDVLDAEGLLVTPGLVDAHTHLVFGGWRQGELAQKLAGASYLDILKGGGGILSTVRATRAAALDALIDKAVPLVEEMMAHGTTTCEAKSGYGLSLEHELKQLEAVRAVEQKSGMDIVPTFMGAHAIPEEHKDDREQYIRLICDEMLPVVSRGGYAEFCDIFCETAVFTAEESEVILKRAKELGFGLKIHADEIDAVGGSQLAARLGAISAEHLIAATDDGIAEMAKSGVIAMLLPATSFYLDKPYARARKMLDEGMAVAVATDFNPGSSPNLNLQLPMNLACLKYRLTPAETLTAVTLNAAAAINRAAVCGSIEPGKYADIVIWDAPDLDYLFYRYGSNLVKKTIKRGVCK